MKPKILVLNHNFMGEGTYLRCYNLSRELVRMGYEMDIVCASPRKYDFAIRTETLQPGLRVITLPRISSSASYIGYALRSLLAVPQALFRQCDLIHSFAVAIPSTALPAIAGGRLRRKKVLIDWDDVWSGGLAGFAAPTAAQIVKYLEHKTPILANAVGITVVGDYLKEYAESLYKDKPVYKIHNGCDSEAIHPVDKKEARKISNIPQGELVLMSMGRTYTRSFEILLSTFKSVLEKRPDAKLYMVGKMCEYGKLAEYLSQTKKRFADIMDRVVFTGPILYGNLKNYLSAADLLLLPMEDCPHDNARFPIRFGDYIASGNVIVSNAVGEIKNLLEGYNAGITAHPNKPDDFAQKILEALPLAESTNGIRRNARKLAEGDLSWPKVAERLDKVYREHLPSRSVVDSV